MEKITTEKITTFRDFYKRTEKGLEQKNDYSTSLDYREYGVKTLQSYVQEIERLKNQPNTIVNETYLKNDSEISLDSLLSGSGITAMLGLLAKEVKHVEIEKRLQISTGGIIESSLVSFKIELF